MFIEEHQKNKGEKYVNKICQAETRGTLHTHTHTHTHTSSLLLSFLSIILISTPSFAYVTNSSQCDNDVLSTYSGSANLTANWQGNNISVTWYNDDTQYASNSCTYGGNLTMPSSIPTKTGYTFKGWRVRCFASQVCSLTGSAVNGLTYNSGAYGFYSLIGQNKINESAYGLSAGEWAVKDTNGGIVKGIASCNSTNPNLRDWGTCNTDTMKSSDTFSPTVSGKYCWCKMESYTPSGGSVCNIASPSWVFNSDNLGSTSSCGSLCAANCAYYVMDYANFRRTLFGVTQ